MHHPRRRQDALVLWVQARPDHLIQQQGVERERQLLFLLLHPAPNPLLDQRLHGHEPSHTLLAGTGMLAP